ncbi:hypothetical protein [Nocardioides currus]|nr:hypothetical protein [Nocardioides currus]
MSNLEEFLARLKPETRAKLMFASEAEQPVYETREDETAAHMR